MAHTFRRWLGRLKGLGYTVDYRVLDASLYGAPTRRKRLFLIARCDGQPIRWPMPTHGPALLGLEPIRTAAECIDWSLPCPSIFERKRPLAEKTMRRIAEGLRRFVLENPRPFIIRTDHHQSHATNAFAPDVPLGTITSANGHAVVMPALMKFRPDSDGAAVDVPMPTITAGGQPRPKRPATGNPLGLLAATMVQTGYGEREGQAPRALDIEKPLGTVVALAGKHALVEAWMVKHFGGVVGHELTRPVGAVTGRDHHSLAAATLVRFNHDDAGVPIDAPAPTVTATGNHIAEVRAFLLAYYSSGSVGQAADRPLRTLTAKARLGLVTVAGQDYQIADIGMRMLEPHELLRAQFGRFAASYDMAAATTKAAKVRLIGNSVCPEIAEAIVRANLPAHVQAVA
jgi:DNA (cytosine-5)-methyltransferase 1